MGIALQRIAASQEFYARFNEIMDEKLNLPLKVDRRSLQEIQYELVSKPFWDESTEKKGLWDRIREPIRISELLAIIDDSDVGVSPLLETWKKNYKILLKDYPIRPEVIKLI